MPYATNRRCCLVLRFRSWLTYSGDVGHRHALRRTLGPPPGRRRETPPQREALPHTLDYNVAECDDLQPGNLGMRFLEIISICSVASRRRRRSVLIRRPRRASLQMLGGV